MRCWSSGANGWAGEYTDGRSLSSPNFFSANFWATAICKLQLILRCCGSEAELEAWQALHLSPTF